MSRKYTIIVAFPSVDAESWSVSRYVYGKNFPAAKYLFLVLKGIWSLVGFERRDIEVSRERHTVLLQMWDVFVLVLFPLSPNAAILTSRCVALVKVGVIRRHEYRSGVIRVTHARDDKRVYTYRSHLHACRSCMLMSPRTRISVVTRVST